MLTAVLSAHQVQKYRSARHKSPVWKLDLLGSMIARESQLFMSCRVDGPGARDGYDVLRTEKIVLSWIRALSVYPNSSPRRFLFKMRQAIVAYAAAADAINAL